ncbi:EAL domain-containing protein [Pseudoalteromonas sp. MMG005]|nr:EAL domain-containing protein [Pseudoalteromonas sp. MMG005]MBQ4845009.1 EAL domain-containing protein [Pseudoalteromonas sp. MMG005]
MPRHQGDGMWVCKKALHAIALILITHLFSNYLQAAQVFNDTSNEVTINEIIYGEGLFSAVNINQAIAEKAISTWLKVDIPAEDSNVIREEILTIYKPVETLLDLYVVEGARVVQAVNLPIDNAVLPRLQSIYPHIKYTTSNTPQQIYIRIRAPFNTKIEHQRLSVRDFSEQAQARLFWYGLELGLLYFVALFIVLIAIFSARKYLSYLGGYLLLLALQCSANNGSIYYYLPQSIARWVTHHCSALVVLGLAACLLFHYSFFKIDKHVKQLKLPTLILTGLLVFMAVLSIGMGSSIAVQVQALSVLTTLGLGVGMCSYLKKEHAREIWVVILAWLPMFILAFTWVSMQMGIFINSALVSASKLAVIFHVTLLGFLIYLRDKRQRDAFVFYTIHDKDTGLPNRLALSRELSKLAAGHKHHTLLLFKPLVLNSIRLNYGMDYADRHLKNLFEQLNLQLDTYGNSTISTKRNDKHTDIYRLDESVFAVILVGKLSLSQVEQYVCLLSSVFEEGIELKGHQLVDKIEIGVAHSPVHAKSAEKLVQRARLALATKCASSERWQLFDVANSVVSERRLKVTSALKTALDKGEFALYMQPQINLTTGKVHGCEGLLRWSHPDLGQVPPDEFIPIAESSGMIYSVTEWVIEQGLRYQKQIVEQFPSHVLSLNISGKDLSKRELTVQLITLINELNLNPRQIILEITESVTIGKEANLKEVVDDYRRIGIKVAIDDFGTGYSSLAYLSQLGFDELKIDKQFVMNIETSRSNQTICKATCDMAHSLGSKVVAEGIESLASYTRLQGYGCDFGQGYFISKPLAMSDYLVWLTKANRVTDVKQHLAR